MMETPCHKGTRYDVLQYVIAFDVGERTSNADQSKILWDGEWILDTRLASPADYFAGANDIICCTIWYL